jgi:branched-chain amino acid transport system ATP-binding protein
MLKVENIDVFYGNIQALHGVSLDVQQGEIVTLIGANGAGKSTLLKTISGLLKPKEGRVSYEGDVISGRSTVAIVKGGIAQVPEGRHVFADMTVKDNLVLGAYVRHDRQGVAADLEKVYEIFPRLRERRKQLAGTLSGGEQQMLAMGRAIMARPRLLLLDEPSMGLAPLMVKTIFSVITTINHSGTTVLLVEQNAHMALTVATRGYVIESGRIVLSGAAAELKQSEEIQKAYLGG